MPEYNGPDPVVEITGVTEVARDVVVVPNRHIDLVPNIGVIGGSGGVGEVSLAEADLDGRMAVAEGGGQAGAGLLSAIGQDPDGDGDGASRGGDPGPDVLGLLQQQAGLIVERGPGAGERDRGGRTVQQHSAKIDLQPLDRPAQRRLGHVQPFLWHPWTRLAGRNDLAREVVKGVLRKRRS